MVGIVLASEINDVFPVCAVFSICHDGGSEGGVGVGGCGCIFDSKHKCRSQMYILPMDEYHARHGEEIMITNFHRVICIY